MSGRPAERPLAPPGPFTSKERLYASLDFPVHGEPLYVCCQHIKFQKSFSDYKTAYVHTFPSGMAN